MTTSTLSPKHQIVIPKEVRKTLGLKPGQRFWVEAKDEHIELRPVPSPEELIGCLKGPEPLRFEREADREF
jgi:AbrB family looped-hinge helix DNA binding protein